MKTGELCKIKFHCWKLNFPCNKKQTKMLKSFSMALALKFSILLNEFSIAERSLNLCVIYITANEYSLIRFSMIFHEKTTETIARQFYHSTSNISIKVLVHIVCVCVDE